MSLLGGGRECIGTERVVLGKVKGWVESHSVSGLYCNTETVYAFIHLFTLKTTVYVH